MGSAQVEVELEEPKKLSVVLSEIFDPAQAPSKYGELVDGLDHHGMAMVLILFSIPAALPIPAAGYSTVLSIPLMAIGLRLILGKDTVWLPEKLRASAFEPAKFRKLLGPMIKLVSCIERFSKPRLVRFSQSKSLTIALGFLICLLAASMALPIPGTNTLPAGGIFLIGFGLLEKDGLLILGGILYSIIAAALTVFIIKFGYEVVKAVILGFFQ